MCVCLYPCALRLTKTLWDRNNSLWVIPPLLALSFSVFHQQEAVFLSSAIFADLDKHTHMAPQIQPPLPSHHHHHLHLHPNTSEPQNPSPTENVTLVELLMRRSPVTALPCARHNPPAGHSLHTNHFLQRGKRVRGWGWGKIDGNRTGGVEMVIE